MFAAVGVPVVRLVRVRIGTLRIDDLRTGPSASSGPRRSGGSPRAARGQATKGGATPPGGAATSAAASPPRLVVALDGPASSGKSSVGAAAALRLGYRFCDTGLLYRALTWLALQRELPLDDGPASRRSSGDVELAPDAQGRLDRVLVDGVDVTEHVHQADVDGRVSEVSRLPEVRAALLERQRDLAARGGIIMAGRDIGTSCCRTRT